MNNKGINIYNDLKRNNKVVYLVSIIAMVAVICSFISTIYIYKTSTKNVYVISEKGELLPLSKLEEKRDRKIEIKSNIKYFTDKYYNLNAYNMKRKQEDVLWLVGSQPTKIIKARIRSGYFDEFLSINGLMQESELIENTLQVNEKEPYQLSCQILIKRINNNVIRPYLATIKMEMINVDRNYPYNPYGLLITQFSEEIQELKEKKEIEQLEQSNEVVNNQVPQ